MQKYEEFVIPDEWYHQDGGRKNGIKYPYQQWQVEEIYRCANDIEYYFSNYVYILNLDRGVVKFNPYPYQRSMLRNMRENRFNIFMIPRQSGKTSTMAAFYSHKLMFGSHEICGVVAHEESQAIEVLRIVKSIITNLPFWMQQGVTKWQQTEIFLENGSRMLCAATSQNALSGKTIKHMYWDECALVRSKLADQFFASIYPTISSSEQSTFTISSTPKGYNHFVKIWKDAKAGRNMFVPFEIKWNDVPGRGDRYKEETIKNIGLLKWQQEFECQILASSNTLLSAQRLEELYHEEPIETGLEGCLKFYEKPNKEHAHVITVDVSEGKNLDYHAINVTDVSASPYKQVATFRSNMIQHQLLPAVIYKLSMLYGDNSVIVIENNSIGIEVLDILNDDYDCPSYIYSEKQLGIRTTTKTKKIGCASLKSLVESGNYEIVDFTTIQECYNFVQSGTSFKAKDGETDDMVMALVLFAYITTTDFFRDFHNDVEKTLKTMFEVQEKEIMEEIPFFGVITGHDDE